MRHVVFLKRLPRLTDAFPKPAGHIADGCQHVVLSGCLHLLTVDDFSGLAVGGRKIQHVLGSDALDGGFNHGCACRSYANLASDRSDKVRVRRLIHLTQCLLDVIFRHETQVRRLFELDLQALRSAWSKTGSPVLLVKSATNTKSFSPRGTRWGCRSRTGGEGEGSGRGH